MNSQYFILLFLVFEKSFGFKPNHQIDRQTKSIFSNKKCTETFTPARYKIRNKKFEQPITNDNIKPEQFFPDMEYPTNIMDASRPFFYKTDESNAMLGPFPDDVKSTYKSLMDKNKKSFEELKAKYINDNALSARNCLQENTVPIPKQETTVEETGTVLKENAEEVAQKDAEEFAEEVAEEATEEVAQKVAEEFAEEVAEEATEEVSEEFAEEVADEMAEEVEETITETSQSQPPTGEEVELTDTTSESDETIETKDSVVDFLKPSALAATSENIGEEEIVAEDHLQSWESVQYFSEEAIAEKISEGDLGPVLEALLESEENLEDINSSALLEKAEDEEAIEISKPENPEEELCPNLTPEKKESARTCDSKKQLNMKLMQKMRKGNFLKRSQKKKPFSLRKDYCKRV